LKRILVINPFGIGDVLFTTPAVRQIRESYPGSFIAYWCNRRTADILKNNPCVDKIFAASRGDIKKIFRASKIKGIKAFLSLLLEIKKGAFDTSLDFSLDHRYSLITKLLGIKRRIGFNYKNRGRFLTDKINIEGYSHKHVIEYYLDLLNILGIIPTYRNMELSANETADIDSKRIPILPDGLKKENAAKETIIGIAPGAGESWGENASFKHWREKNFAELADKLIEKHRAKILLLGSEKEKKIAENIVKTMKNKVIDLTGKTTLEELIAVISKIDILITNDGGPLHIAAALGKKTVSIFGPVSETVYGPYPPSEKHIVIKKDIPCRPCYQKFKLPRCLREKECINSIGTEEVLTATEKLL